MGDNPYHNQHITEFTACMDEALTELQLYYDAKFLIVQELLEKLETLETRIAQLEEAQEKPVEIETNVKLNEKSANDLRKKIINLFKW